jgi:peptidoglycan/LPS O-acetylase OafA/YrhL
MRLFLAMSVVLSHTGSTYKMIPGDVAVEVFFAISGFYMSLILTGKYNSRTTFYVNRFLRLYPVYLVVMVATWTWFVFTWIYLGRVPTNPLTDAYQHMSWWQIGLLVISDWTMVGLDIPSLFHFTAEKGFLLFHSLAAGVAPDGATFAGSFRAIEPAWSIGVEIWFYLIAPFLMMLRSHWIVLIALLSIALKIVMTKFELATYFFFPAQLFFFMAGILLHRAYVGTTSIRKLDGRVGSAVLMTVLVLFVVFDKLPEQIAICNLRHLHSCHTLTVCPYEGEPL